MTREEAIEILCDGECENLIIKFHGGRSALDLALAALRFPTREMVERMRGEWMFPIFGDQQSAEDPRCQCSECGSIEMPLARHRFCPSCGAPMTDEAVDMMLRQWKEAVDGETNRRR